MRDWGINMSYCALGPMQAFDFRGVRLVNLKLFRLHLESTEIKEFSLHMANPNLISFTPLSDPLEQNQE